MYETTSAARELPATGARGYALLSVVVITAALLVAGVATVQLTRDDLRRTALEAAHEEAFYNAETGVEHALTRLDTDRATANTSTSYSATVSGTNYSAAISQDPNYPSDARRKLIVSTGSSRGSTSTVVAHTDIQPHDTTPTPGTEPPTTPTPEATPPTNARICDALLASYAGDARIFGVADLNVPGPPAATLFSGNVLTNPNHDVRFTLLANLAANAYGTVLAGRDFISSSGLNVTTSATLYMGGSYTSTIPHCHGVLCVPLGFHFVNGGSGHGENVAPTTRRFPRPHYKRLRQNPRTIIVREGNVPVGSWNAGTWEYDDTLVLGSFDADPEVIYYVEGNAKIDTLLLAANAAVKIVARGWLAIENLGLVTAGAECTSFSRMIGPASAGASVCAAAGPDTVQQFHLIAEEDLVIGYDTTEVATDAAIESAFLTAAITTTASGPGLGFGGTVANVLGHSDVMAYSENGEVWVMLSAIAAGADARLNLCSRDDATLAFVASVATNVTTYHPVAFD